MGEAQGPQVLEQNFRVSIFPFFGSCFYTFWAAYLVGLFLAGPLSWLEGLAKVGFSLFNIDPWSGPSRSDAALSVGVYKMETFQHLQISFIKISPWVIQASEGIIPPNWLFIKRFSSSLRISLPR
jgi:hypothetical protein